MARSYLLIDGYNLMHAGGSGRQKYGPGQLQRLRNRLLRYLAVHLTALERERATIVFDAGQAPADLARESSFEEMTIRFAPPGNDADDTIEELIAGHSAPRQIRLVSSDHRLQRAVRRRRGTFVDSEDFVDELERRERAGKRRGDARSGGPRQKTEDSDRILEAGAPMETQMWLKVFGDLPKAIAVRPDLESLEPQLSQQEIDALQAEIDRAAAERALPPPKKKSQQSRSPRRQSR